MILDLYDREIVEIVYFIRKLHLHASAKSPFDLPSAAAATAAAKISSN